METTTSLSTQQNLVRTLISIGKQAGLKFK